MTTAAARVELSIYDLDRTITRLPTWTAFLLYVARRRAPWRLALLPAVGVLAAMRALGRIDRDRLKVAMHRLLLGSHLPEPTAAGLAGDFARRWVRDHVRPGARAALAEDRAAGRRIVIATAAHRFYAQAIADALEIPDLIATEAQRDGEERILPGLDGSNCYGPAKLVAIEAWLAKEGLDRTAIYVRFYSDHASDVSVLGWADEAIAVNPHAPLRRIAKARGWRIVDWS